MKREMRFCIFDHASRSSSNIERIVLCYETIVDEDYDYGTELEDKLDVEILLWLFKFQQRYRIPDTALEALIKFLNYTLMMIDDSKFCEFPASLFLAKEFSNQN